LAVMRIRAFVALLAVVVGAAACGRGSGGVFRQYEYEEETYLSLDGSATVYVNSSVAALDALRGASFDIRPNGRVDRNDVRAYFTTPASRVTKVNLSRRSNRRFVHVRIDVDDIRKLGQAPPFAWSTYRFYPQDGLLFYRQSIGRAAGKQVGQVGWTGDEIVAFRLHLPSKIAYHNTGTAVRRGNILVWEQTLRERLAGKPLTLDGRMETQSILYRTLFLFGVTFAAVALTFGVIIWAVFRRGRSTA
jgi:hypothetical protein